MQEVSLIAATRPSQPDDDEGDRMVIMAVAVAVAAVVGMEGEAAAAGVDAEEGEVAGVN